MRTFLSSVIFILSIGFTMDVFAQTKSIIENASIGNDTANETMLIVYNTGEIATTNKSEEEYAATRNEIDEAKKDREKTINDINTFLIESYKIKIDRILANLNLSIERITKNDPVMQTKLLEKIRGDVSIKIHTINSRNISENRKKILSSIFSYIQENLDANISRLAQQK